MTTFTIPSAPADRKSINNALKEICNHLTIKESAATAIKDIATVLKDDFDMPLRTVNRLSKVMYKSDFKEKLADFDEFESEYEMLIKGIS